MFCEPSFLAWLIGLAHKTFNSNKTFQMSSIYFPFLQKGFVVFRKDLDLNQ